MKPVTVYVTHSCPFCHQALRWLSEHPETSRNVQVQFVDNDRRALSEFRSHGFSGVPAFVAANDQWSGWDPGRLQRVMLDDA